MLITFCLALTVFLRHASFILNKRRKIFHYNEFSNFPVGKIAKIKNTLLQTAFSAIFPLGLIYILKAL